MELTYHGHSCIRLRGREMTVLIDPPQTALPGLAKGTVGMIVRTEGTTDPAKLRPRRRGPGGLRARRVRDRPASASSVSPPVRPR